MNEIILRILKFVRFIHVPRVVKYVLFRCIKGRNIPVQSKIGISEISITLDIGNFIEYWIFMDSLYEKDWVWLVQKYVEDKIFLNVGANIGAYDFSLARVAKHIYAFEPEDENCKKLTQNIKQSHIDNITVIKKAVGLTDNKKVKLFVHDKEKGWHSMVVNYKYGYKMVSTVKLDTFVKEKRIKNIGLIKIDVEGLEYDVLKGALVVLDKLRPAVVVEFNRPVTVLSEHSLIEIFDLMKEHRYRGFRKINGQMVLLTKDIIDKIYNENILFLPKEKK